MARLPLLALLLLCLVPACLHAQDPLTTLPHTYWKVFENADVTVIRAHYGPHEAIPVHDHEGSATVFVYLNASSPVRIDHTEDGRTESVVRPPTVKGAFRVIQGVAERHSIENLGDKPSDFLRVELKRATITVKDGFRGSAPATLDKDTDTTVFYEPTVRIERIVCAKEEVCAVTPVESPSLLIALSDLTIAAGTDTGAQAFPLGDVRWLNASQALSVTPLTGSSSHLLRIVLSPNAH